MVVKRCSPAIAPSGCSRRRRLDAAYGTTANGFVAARYRVFAASPPPPLDDRHRLATGLCRLGVGARRPLVDAAGDATGDACCGTDSVVYPLPILRHGPGRVVWKRFLRQRFVVDRLIHLLVDECRATGGPDRDDVVAVLLAARNPDSRPLSRRQLRDNIVTMLASGHETTASQLAWAFPVARASPARAAALDRGDRQ